MAINPGVWYCRDNSTISPVVFTASQSGTTLTVTAVASGALAVGTVIFTTTNSPQGVITAGSGPTYTVSFSQTIASTTWWGFAATAAGSLGWSSVAAWQAGHSYAAGALVRQAAIGAVFTASAPSSSTLTVSAVTSGTIVVGQSLYSTAGINTISAYGTGTGGTGTYTISSATIASQLCVAILPPGNERVFACVAAGTSGSTEPNWVLTKGAKTTDNTATWIEVTGQPGVNGDMTNTPSWIASTAAALGNIVKDAAATHLFVCTTAGTTKSGAEPTWGTTAGNTTTDNTATWTCLGGVSSAWAASAARVASMLATTWAQAAGYIYVANDHAEVQPTAINVTSINGTAASPNYVVSVGAATVPPTSASWSAGASMTTVGPNALTLLSSTGAGIYVYGLTASAGTGATSATFSFSAARGTLDTCTVGRQGTTQTNIQFGSNNDVTLISPTFRFGTTTDRIATSSRIVIKGISTLLASGSAAVTGLVTINSISDLEVSASDLSALGSGTVISSVNIASNVRLSGCKLGSSAVISATPVAGGAVYAVNCDGTGTDYQKYANLYQGVLTTETTVVRTGGAAIDTTAVSDKIVTNSNTSWLNPFEAPRLAIWNATVGSAVTVTIYGLAPAGLPKNDEIWMEVEYPGSASSPLVSVATTTKANAMATASNATSDGSTWGGSGTGFKLTAAFTPQMAGPIYIRPKAGKVSSTFYIDPLPVLS